MDWGLVTLLMEFMSFLISCIVGYYALKTYRANGSRGLFLLYTAFMILGISIFLRLITLAYFAVILGVLEASRLSSSASSTSPSGYTRPLSSKPTAYSQLPISFKP